MTTDDELRDALRTRAADERVAATPWADVPVRARRIHRRRRTFQGGVAAAVVVAVTFGVLAVTGAFDGDTHRSIVAAPPDQQGDLVVAFADRIVEMTEDGDIIRTIHEAADIAGSVSVTPDARFVYFSSGRENCSDGKSWGPTTIERVPVAGGPVEHVQEGGHPLVSPDGRWLAWTSDGCTATRRLFVTNIDENNAVERLATPDDIVVAAWSADSSRLLARLGSATSAQWIEARVPAGNLRPPLFADDVTALTYADGDAVLAAFGSGTGYRVVREALPGQGDPEPRYAATGLPPTAIALGSDDRLLVHHRTGTLQMQQGSEPPRTIAVGVEGAAWIPTSEPDTSTTTTTTAPPPDVVEGLPPRVIAHHADGRVLELEATSGQVLREMSSVPGPPEPTIAVTPDGTTIYAERRTDIPDRGCDLSSPLASEIVEIDRATGTVRPFLDTPARWPAVSPDGRFLAYVRIDRCDAPTSLVVRDLVDGTQRVWSWPDPHDGGPMPQLRGPLSFGPESSHLLAFVHRAADVQAWLVDTSGVIAQDALRPVPAVPAGPVSPGFHAQRFLGDSGFLGAATFGDVPNIYSLDPESGMAAGQGIVWSSSGSVRGELGWTLVDSEPSARHLLLVVDREDGTHLERVVAFDSSDHAASPRIRLGPDGIVAAAWAP